MCEIRSKWSDVNTADGRVARLRLEWLGHLARMPDHWIPKFCLFGWLTEPRPRCGPRRRWRDVIKWDLQEIDVDESEWYEEACSSRAGWRAICRLGLDTRMQKQATAVDPGQAARHVVYSICMRPFRRESDRKRHKCSNEQAKPVLEQQGSVHCLACDR